MRQHFEITGMKNIRHDSIYDTIKGSMYNNVKIDKVLTKKFRMK